MTQSYYDGKIATGFWASAWSRSTDSTQRVTNACSPPPASAAIETSRFSPKSPQFDLTLFGEALDHIFGEQMQ